MNRSPGETENRSSACGTVFLWDFVLLTEIFRQRQCLSVFLSPEKEKLRKRKSCKGDAPLTPAVSSDTTTACGSSGEGSVQAAQRGQVGVRTVKHPAAN